MVTPSGAGAVVLVRFPFTDLSTSKLRPAVVLANVGRDDWVLGQLTSKSYADPYAVEIKNTDFASGSLKIISYARPGKLFTANENLMVAQVGVLKKDAHQRVVDAIVRLLQAGK